MSKKKHDTFFPPPALPCTGVESHAHLDSPQFGQDLDAVLERAKCAGVQWLAQIFLSPAAWHQGHTRFMPYNNLFFLLGIHPCDAHKHGEESLEAIRAICEAQPRIKAVGEIGLDYYWKECPPQVQDRFFRAQLTLAKSLDLPVVIHCRDAVPQTLAVLEEEGMGGYPLLWHCFGGDAALAERIVDKGWHISIPGPVTYPANTALREAVAMVPADRLLVETDCPYLAPVPLRGKRNEPAFLGYTIAAMAKARNVPVEELWTLCGTNAKRFFNLH